MNYKYINLLEDRDVLTVYMNSGDNKNALHTGLLEELLLLLDSFEHDSQKKILVFRNKGDYFCSGMELNVVESNFIPHISPKKHIFYTFLSRLTRIAGVVISVIEGKTIAGGIGIVAASDIAIASLGTSFNLTELLFGMGPYLIYPFLLRRLNVQKINLMALTAKAFMANDARSIGLIDEYGDDVSELLRINIIKLRKLSKDVIRTLKNYAELFYNVDSFATLACSKFYAELSNDDVIKSLKTFRELIT